MQGYLGCPSFPWRVFPMCEADNIFYSNWKIPMKESQHNPLGLGMKSCLFLPVATLPLVSSSWFPTDPTVLDPKAPRDCPIITVFSNLASPGRMVIPLGAQCKSISKPDLPLCWLFIVSPHEAAGGCWGQSCRCRNAHRCPVRKWPSSLCN